MKKIFLAFLCSSSLVACQTKYDGYILNGNIGGNSEGMKVQLVNEAVYPPVTIDSTVIKNGRFQLKGKVDRPGMYQLIIDKTGQAPDAAFCVLLIPLDMTSPFIFLLLPVLYTFYYLK